MFIALAFGHVERAYQAVLAEAEQYPVTPNGYAWQRGLLFMLAGFIVAVPPGYISHLVLDAATPRGLPIMGRLSA